MKSILSFAMALTIFICLAPALVAQQPMTVEGFTAEISRGIPEGFKMDENGRDKNDLYVVYKKNPQEIITVNLQKEYRIDFPEQETTAVDGRKTIFYYAGFNKSAGLVVYLKNNAGYLVFGYNKPYMGDEIVEKSELLDIVNKIDLSKFE